MITRILANFIALVIIHIGRGIDMEEIGVIRFIFPWAIMVVVLEASVRYELKMDNS